MKKFFRFGTLVLIDAQGKSHTICAAGEPRAVIRLTDAATQRKLLIPNSLSWSEAYMDGRLLIEEGNLNDLLEIYVKSDLVAESSRLGELVRLVHSVVAAGKHYNPAGRARKNVAHHYDLSAELYDQFLDSDRQYSCAYFRDGEEDIEQAQILKKRHIAAKLDIKPGMKVLDIGCGWGGLGLYIATHFDCDVTGVTLSEEQHSLAMQRVREAGLEDRVRFELRDYRSLDQQFDRIVSVGMLEHVGQFQYKEYFGKVKKLLAEDGVALIHTIGRMNKPRPINAWMQKYIFPGAYLPTASQLCKAIEGRGLWLTDFENLRIHYADTLACWYQRFAERWDHVVSLYDERFCRMWELYLLGCEKTFRYQDITVFQLQLTREIGTLPLTRDYIHEVENSLAEMDRDLIVAPINRRESA